ncbi:3-phosphoinositide-dependent protein kinase 1-like isoform X2 [Tubulanus polymorphus]|uniref:3-phosphoinositide-dependent protein kinase 1-like isoform X2 n=1 Tax=Tubulanus polymorphus TaxID=672921 RepID=UPI003DA5D15F
MSTASPGDSGSGSRRERNDPPIKSSSPVATSAKTPHKKKPTDFKFGKLIGEGSFSSVFLAKEISNGKEYAMKVCDKAQIIREKKVAYISREKEILYRINHPFFVKLHFTFQDTEKLYFGLSYARRGELLDYLKKLGSFDEHCTQFYSAEIILALEHLHSQGIIHRDLKPENILLNDEMHIQVTDFGSAKIMDGNQHSSTSSSSSSASQSSDGNESSGVTRRLERRNSFVGTAQYVSPEVLKSQSSYYSSDLWALGCIIYQMLSGLPPLRGRHEYEIFQKICKLEYEFPEGFNPTAKHLVESLLVLDPTKRLGCEEMGGYPQLKSHSFYHNINWDQLPNEKPPQLLPYLPATNTSMENLWSECTAGFDDVQYSRLLGIELHDSRKSQSEEKSSEQLNAKSESNGTDVNNSNLNHATESSSSSSNVASSSGLTTVQERHNLLVKQAAENEYHQFVEGNLILKQGLVDKRKGLFARRRMLLLTEGPHLYYVDPANMVLKGEMPWSSHLWPEAKNFKIFFVHTPNRTYYLEDPQGYALEWVKRIREVKDYYYEDNTASPSNSPPTMSKTTKS